MVATKLNRVMTSLCVALAIAGGSLCAAVKFSSPENFVQVEQGLLHTHDSGALAPGRWAARELRSKAARTGLIHKQLDQLFSDEDPFEADWAWMPARDLQTDDSFAIVAISAAVYAQSWSILHLFDSTSTNANEIFERNITNPFIGPDGVTGWNVYAVAWQFGAENTFALGVSTGSGNEVRIYSFNGSEISLVTSFAHNADIDSADWNPVMHQYLAVAGRNQTGTTPNLRVFTYLSNTLTNLTGCQIKDTSQAIQGLSWHPSGLFLATGSTSDLAKVYGFNPVAQTLTLLTSVSHGADISAVRWSQSGQYLALVGYNTGGSTPNVRIYSFDGVSVLTELTNCRLQLQAPGYAIEWHPSGHILAIGGATASENQEIVIAEFDQEGTSVVATGSFLQQNIASLAWTNDGLSLVAVGNPGSDNFDVRLYNFCNGILTEEVAQGDSEQLFCTRISALSNYAAVGGYNGYADNVRVYPLPNQSLVTSNSNAIVAASDALVASSYAIWAQAGEIYRWHLAGTSVAATGLESGDAGVALAWSPNGEYVALVGAGGLFVCGFSGNLQLNASDSTSAYSVDWDSAGEHIVTAGSSTIQAYSWDGSTLTKLCSLGISNSNVVAWHPTEYIVATGTLDGTVQLYTFDPSPASFTALGAPQSHGDAINAIRWSHSGNYLAIGGGSGDGESARIYSFDGVSVLTELYSSDIYFPGGTPVTTLAWDPYDLHLAFGLNDGEVWVVSFDGTSVVMPGSPSFQFSTGVTGIDWSSDNHFLLATVTGYGLVVLRFASDVLTPGQVTVGSANTAVRVDPAGEFAAVASTNSPWLLLYPLFRESLIQSDSNAIAVGVTANSDAIIGLFAQVYREDLSSTSIPCPDNGSLDEPSQVAWQPGAENVLAVGTAVGEGDTLRIYSFNGTSMSFVTSATTGLTYGALAWAPTGNGFFAAGGTGGSSDLSVWQFDGSSLSNTLDTTPGGFQINSLSWHPNGEFLAVGILNDIDSTTHTTAVYRYYEASSLMLRAETSFTYADTVYSVEWDPTGTYLLVAAGNNGGALPTIRVYQFDQVANLTELVGCQITAANSINSVSWNPMGDRIIATNENGDEFLTYVFDGTSLTPLPNATVTLSGLRTNGVAWTPNAPFIVGTSQDFSGTYMLRLTHDVLDVIESVGGLPGAPSEVSISPFGNYLAVAMPGVNSVNVIPLALESLVLSNSNAVNALASGGGGGGDTPLTIANSNAVVAMSAAVFAGSEAIYANSWAIAHLAAGGGDSLLTIANSNAIVAMSAAVNANSWAIANVSGAVFYTEPVLENSQPGFTLTTPLLNSIGWGYSSTADTVFVGGDDGGGNQLFAYTYDPVSGLSEVGSAVTSVGATVNSVNVVPIGSGNIVAIGSDVPGDNKEVRVYQFGGGSFTHLSALDTNVGAAVYSVAGHPSQEYIAVGGQTGNGGAQVRVLYINYPTDLVDPSGTDMVHGAQVNSVAWSPNGNYLAIGGQVGTGGYEVRVYQFAVNANGGTTESLSDIPGCNMIHGATINGIAWSSDGTKLAVVGAQGNTGTETRVYTFTDAGYSSALTETLGTAPVHGATLNNCQWGIASDDQSYLVVGGASSAGTTVRLFNVESTISDATDQNASATIDSVAWHPTRDDLVAVGGSTGSPNGLLETYAIGAVHESLPYANSWAIEHLAQGGGGGDTALTIANSNAIVAMSASVFAGSEAIYANSWAISNLVKEVIASSNAIVAMSAGVFASSQAINANSWAISNLADERLADSAAINANSWAISYLLGEATSLNTATADAVQGLAALRRQLRLAPNTRELLNQFELDCDLDLDENHRLLISENTELRGNHHVIRCVGAAEPVILVEAGVIVRFADLTLSGLQPAHFALGEGAWAVFGDGVTVELGGSSMLSYDWLFAGMTRLDGQGHCLTFDQDGGLVVRSGAELAIKNLFLRSAGIWREDDTSLVTFE